MWVLTAFVINNMVWKDLKYMKVEIFERIIKTTKPNFYVIRRK